MEPTPDTAWVTKNQIAQEHRINPNIYVLLKEHSNTRLLMTFCYTQRSMPCSAIITETSSCSRGKQRATARHYTEWKTLGYSALNGLSPSNLFFWGSGNPAEEESERMLRARKNVKEGMEDTKKTRPSYEHVHYIYELSEIEAACTGPTRVHTRFFLYIRWLSL